jgi:hypothetical protein
MQNLPLNFQKKKTLIENKQLAADFLPLTVNLSIHDVSLCFHVNSEEIVKELYDHYPLSWFCQSRETQIDIYWHDSRSLGWPDEAWEDEINPDCTILNQNQKVIALQRDFVASLVGARCELICPYSLHDGFYNFLRWLLPRLFLENGHMLLHSSCILDDKGQAYFSLGASGAGKSTISSYRPRKKILGDDMNVIKVEDGKCWAQAGALGQAILNPAEYSHWYPVRALLWLQKSDRVSVRPMDRSSQLCCLSSSVANVFWDQLAQDQSQKIFQFTQEILNHVPLFELSFPKKEKVWNEIFFELDHLI